MTQVMRLFYVALSVAVGAPLIGCVLAGQFVAAGAFVMLGAVWWVVQRREIGRNDALLIAIVAGAAISGNRGVSVLALLPGVLGALAAWDLAWFAVRLRRAPMLTGESVLVQRHLRQLGAALGLGLAASLLALGIRLEFEFIIMFSLAAAVLIGLAWLMWGALRNEAG
jgi:hypothetical protein